MTTENIVGKIIGSFIFLLMCVFFILIIASLNKNKVSIIDVPCYDKEGSEIKFQICEKQLYDYGWLNFIFEDSVINNDT